MSNKEIFDYIIIVFVVTVIGILINTQNYKDLNKRLTEQEQYMRKVQADVDNLYKVVE